MRAMLYSGMIGDFMAKVLLVHPGIDVNVQDQVRDNFENACAYVIDIKWILC